jgi:hypothetical protein
MKTLKTKNSKSKNEKPKRTTKKKAESTVSVEEKKQKWEKEDNIVTPLKRAGKVMLLILGSILAFALLVFIYINLPVRKNERQIPLGVTFSTRYAQDINLDWKEVFVAMLDDLKIRQIRIPAYWDLIEKTEGEYDFSDLDWQLDQAEKRDAKVILVVGQKVPRWPECFIPEWAKNDDAKRKEKLLEVERLIVERYKDRKVIQNWQVENEPFLSFGICPKADPALLDREIANVKSVDATHPVVITDSGELSLWYKAASRADVFGTTMYREVYSQKMGHWRYPIGPNFFKLKKAILEKFVDNSGSLVIELQGEPWVGGWTTSQPIDVQLASMNADILKDNVEFAKKTNFDQIYLWGVEWWYWMKVKQDNPTLWQQAREIYQAK